MDLPERFVERLSRIVPPERLDMVLEAFSVPRNTVFWLNPLRAPARKSLQVLRALGLDPRPLPWHSGAFEVEAGERERLVGSAPARQGAVYPLDASSLLPVPVLDPRPGERVLDLAAAPGGKTIQIAAAMENTGSLSAVEAVRPRFHRLKANLARCGVTHARLYLKDGRRVGRAVPERFDRVLLDAPCSTEGGFRTADPRTWRQWSLRKVQECARKQRGLLLSAFQALRPGGVLVYCTCTFAPEENEAVVDALLARARGQAELEPLALPAGVPVQSGLTRWEKHRFAASLVHAVRILPDHRFGGFFLCRIRKCGGSGAGSGPS